MKFRLLHGNHGQIMTHFANGRKYVSGNIIETSTDLATKFNHPGSVKFEKVQEDTPSSPGMLLKMKEEPAPEPVVPPARHNLDGMSFKELQTLAQDEEIDIKGLTKREELLVKIKRELQAVST